MKKLALILALMIIPCSAFGLEMLNDNAMDQVTGQSGVSIALDDVQLFINIEKMAWIDCDGYTSAAQWYGTCAGSPGALALNNFQIDVLNINAIVSSTISDDQANAAGFVQTSGTPAMQLYSTACGNIPLFYDYGQTGTGTCYLNGTIGTQTAGLDNYINPRSSLDGAFQARHLSIDATDDLPALSAGVYNNTGSSASTMGGVLIGLPTVEVYINYMSLTPVYDGDVNNLTSTALNDDDNALGTLFGLNNPDFGTIALEGITFTVLSGWLEIAPH